MSNTARAAAMERMSAAIFLAIDQNGGAEDALVVMGALGAVIGAVARATGKPDDCLASTLRIAQGVINGSLE